MEFLAHLTAFFQVIQTILFDNVGVLANLVADGLGVVAKVRMLLLFYHALLLFGTFLLLDYTEEGITLHFCLLAEHFFAFAELSLAGNIEISGVLSTLFGLKLFLKSLGTFVLFKSAFLSEGVDLRLTVSGSFLEIT